MGNTSQSEELAAKLFDQLREDSWRREHPVSSDIADVEKVMFHPYAWEDEIVQALRAWCTKRQPCNFGRVAAKYGAIHFCFITERNLRAGDRAVAEKIAESKRLWKRRAVSDRKSPPHSFMLCVIAPRLSLAAPDRNLFDFASHIRDLAGWTPNKNQVDGQEVSGDYLYLKHPTDGFYYGYQYNVDFFATAGDGRWWHDHRLPGGIGFTANATGHMRAFQELYLEPGSNKGDWFLRNAMFTISQAHPTKKHSGDGPEKTPPAANGEVSPEAGPAKTPERYNPSPHASDPAHPANEGRVTWLRDLEDGKPFKKSACPFSGAIPKVFEGKDWTTYEGLLHTDHAVRPEFFDGREYPATAAQPYLMDFTYLYEKAESDNVHFTAGVRVAEGDVMAEIGEPKNWPYRSVSTPHRPPGEETVVRQLVARCVECPEGEDLIDHELRS